MRDSGKILAVLCATEETEGLRRTRKSLNDNGIDCFVYGLGEAWQGNGMKQVALQHAAETFLGKFEVLLSLDGYDTLCLASGEEIYWKFKSFQHPMVIGAELGCWPDKDLASKYPITSTSPFRYLNGGGCVAQTEYLVEMMRKWGVSKEFRAPSDQRFITKNFLEDPNCMKLDTECIIFQNLCGIKPDYFTLNGKRLTNKVTSGVPCILHGNGHTNMDWYWEIIK